MSSKAISVSVLSKDTTNDSTDRPALGVPRNKNRHRQRASNTHVGSLPIQILQIDVQCMYLSLELLRKCDGNELRKLRQPARISLKF